jgi:capsular polysaccharide biosynthesis protein
LEIWSFFGVIGRHWRIVVPALVVTFVGAGLIVLTAKPDYEVSGTVVMLLGSKQTGADGAPVNPWFSADSSASQFASLMVDSISGREFEERVGALGVPDTFIIATSAARPAVVTMTVVASSPGQAAHAYDVLRDAFRREVERRQAALGAPLETRYSVYDLTVPAEAKVVRTRIKLAIAFAGVGLVMSVLLAAALELGGAVRRQRETMRRRRSGPVLVGVGAETGT